LGHWARHFAAPRPSRQPIPKIIRPHHLYLAQRMVVRQMAHNPHGLRLRLLVGKVQQGVMGFGV
jgi:hypothetical protein